MYTHSIENVQTNKQTKNIKTKQIFNLFDGAHTQKYPIQSNSSSLLPILRQMSKTKSKPKKKKHCLRHFICVFCFKLKTQNKPNTIRLINIQEDAHNADKSSPIHVSSNGKKRENGKHRSRYDCLLFECLSQ